MNLAEAVAARRSVRSFTDRTVARADVERAIALAVQAPAPHHSAPWRFALLEDAVSKQRFSHAMGAEWRRDLVADGHPSEKVEEIVGRSHQLLTSTPLLVVCCADMAKAHAYPDERRRRAEWSLFAHSVGAALQTFMLALGERGIASCWISAPVFCGEVVKEALALPATVEPHALVLVGYASPDYEPRPRDVQHVSAFIHETE
jgi:coenzyme F420-0:L-glutamate ligase / coenzyme F420-1:gamma-L-glutamate ligase